MDSTAGNHNAPLQRMPPVILREIMLKFYKVNLVVDPFGPDDSQFTENYFLERRSHRGPDFNITPLLTSRAIYNAGCSLLYSAKFLFTSASQQEVMKVRLLNNSSRYRNLAHVGYIVPVGCVVSQSLHFVFDAAKDFIAMDKLDLHLIEDDETTWKALQEGKDEISEELEAYLKSNWGHQSLKLKVKEMRVSGLRGGVGLEFRRKFLNLLGKVIELQIPAKHLNKGYVLGDRYQRVVWKVEDMDDVLD
ncbi:hypothetical protein G7Y89_g11699 [Cudoniella acicularis]|uniref:Uncharacterized protein n=1 Tax=Cudoniella acicularis TaxID=354080 RepID=A0A8H4VZX0_9HELO|nr:hypothetical protein G7Y89_g11699 [Cudoniella acicularis]